MATMIGGRGAKKGPRSTPAPQSPRRVNLDEGVLVLPPVSLREMPPGGSVGSFMGVAAMKFSTPMGTVAVFLHDLGADDVAAILTAQRRQAEAQLGAGYGRRAFWWEQP